MDIDDLLKQADTIFETIPPVDQEVVLGEKVVTVRLRKIDPTVWRDLAAMNPPRPGATADQRRGYNLTGMLRAYPSMRDKGDALNVAFISEDDQSETDVASRWEGILNRLAPSDIQNLEIALWALNEYDPAKQAASGKARKGETKS